YSISSAPFGTNTFTITVKRVAGGPVSNHLHDAVAVGDRLHADGPYGLFSTSFHPAEKHLFLSAGSGITPIMSMVRSRLARQPRGHHRPPRTRAAGPGAGGQGRDPVLPRFADRDLAGPTRTHHCRDPRRGGPRPSGPRDLRLRPERVHGCRPSSAGRARFRG